MNQYAPRREGAPAQLAIVRPAMYRLSRPNSRVVARLSLQCLVSGHVRSALALGMEGGVPQRRGDKVGLCKEADGEADRKRVWERLGPAPRLAGEFAEDELEPPKKRTSPGDGVWPSTR